MRLSIVWRCALTIAVSQIAVFVTVSALVLASGLAPLYREWSGRATETLQAHHKVLHNIAGRHGLEAAVSAAEKLDTDYLKHQVIEKDKWGDSGEYFGLTPDQWVSLMQTQRRPIPHDGWLCWITMPIETDGGAPPTTPVVVLSSNRLLIPDVLWKQPAGAALWIGGSILLAALVGGLVATWFTRPILRLRRSVMQFAAGHLDTRPDEDLQSRRDELGDLTRDLTTMKDRIANLVTAHRQLLDDVAHELRSPLARMNVSLDLAERIRDERQAEPSNESDKFLARIRRECEQLANMVDRLLQLSALEHQIDSDERMEINLTHLARDVAEDCHFEAQSANRSVTLEVEQDFYVSGSPDMLRSALENTVRNAIRYTPEGNRVDIKIAAAPNQPNRAHITVRDYGHGVPEASLSKIFLPFYRVESDRNPASGGTGLGLALADRAIRAHAGTISAQNHTEGGLELKIYLPLNAISNRDFANS